jgi:hypothetical protein
MRTLLSKVSVWIPSAIQYGYTEGMFPVKNKKRIEDESLNHFQKLAHESVVLTGLLLEEIFSPKEGSKTQNQNTKMIKHAVPFTSVQMEYCTVSCRVKNVYHKCCAWYVIISQTLPKS